MTIFVLWEKVPSIYRIAYGVNLFDGGFQNQSSINLPYLRFLQNT